MTKSDKYKQRKYSNSNIVVCSFLPIHFTPTFNNAAQKYSFKFCAKLDEIMVQALKWNLTSYFVFFTFGHKKVKTFLLHFSF